MHQICTKFNANKLSKFLVLEKIHLVWDGLLTRQLPPEVKPPETAFPAWRLGTSQRVT